MTSKPKRIRWILAVAILIAGVMSAFLLAGGIDRDAFFSSVIIVPVLSIACAALSASVCFSIVAAALMHGAIPLACIWRGEHWPPDCIVYGIITGTVVGAIVIALIAKVVGRDRKFSTSEDKSSQRSLWPHSLNFYFMQILILGVVGLPVGWLRFVAQMEREHEISIVLAIAGAIISIYMVVVFCMLLHRAWSCIQNRGARTTPGKAVGFCFIPFFNLYWMFQAILGLAKDFNRTREDGIPPISEPVALWLCILNIISMIPFVSFVAQPTSLILMLIYVRHVYRSIDACHASFIDEQEAVPLPPSSSDATADRLRELKKLKDEEILTEEEYQEKRRHLLKEL